jgi:hypothetical protein
VDVELVQTTYAQVCDLLDGARLLVATLEDEKEQLEELGAVRSIVRQVGAEPVDRVLPLAGLFAENIQRIAG